MTGIYPFYCTHLSEILTQLINLMSNTYHSCPLTQSLHEMAQRIDTLTNQLPETWTDGDPVVDQLVGDVQALESEWLVDPDARAAFSSIQDADD